MLTFLIMLTLQAGKPTDIYIPNTTTYQNIFVATCDDHSIATIYSDKKMIYAMPNPIVVDPTGHAKFTVGKTGCYVVSAKEWGSKPNR